MPNLPNVMAEGDLRASLEALRDVLAAEIADGMTCRVCGGGISSPTAALARQLRDTLTQLSTLSAPSESRTDDLREQRALRQASVAKRASAG